MKKTWKNLLCTVLLGATAATGSAQASVVIDNTRVIFRGGEREVTIKLTNQGNASALVQTWMDKGDPDSSPDKIDVPFTLTPTMFRLDPKKGQTLRMIYTKEPLAQDRETLFWLNVLEVPPKATDEESGENRLQLAFRTRIKVMFRPKGLAGESIEAPAQVTWRVVPGKDGHGYALKGENPTPYFVNFGELSVKTRGNSYEAGNGFIPPMGSETFPIEKLTQQPDAAAEVDYLAINDYGAGMTGKRALAAPAAR
ncbi:fimbria/pilus periplasmic chaperone [Burkholderia ambifaria]|uniref:fimbrial biogenesis chaperone n=1 Tax=Burkholderia ambifaria TaxID=152480 RepID=UPI0015898263|nr:fimbria/pilus periplasmic chaperone [Burkholderia ambifaria]QQJ97043.1 fimbria/pilus periplasmic chaperone [Burkholderia ambifaria]